MVGLDHQTKGQIMSAMKMLLEELLEKVGLPLHGYLMNVPLEMREQAIELWNQNHRAVCQCQEFSYLNSNDGKGWWS